MGIGSESTDNWIPQPRDQLMRECCSEGNARGLPVLAGAVTVLLLVACRNPTAPAKVGGQYQLLSVNGDTVPCCTQTIEDTIPARIEAGFLYIGYPPDRYEWTMRYAYQAADGRTVSVRIVSTGGYSVRSDTVIFVDDASKPDGTTGILVSPSHMLINRAGNAYQFFKLVQTP